MRSIWRTGWNGRRGVGPAFRPWWTEVGVYVGWSFLIGIDSEWHPAEWRLSIHLGPLMVRMDGLR